MKTFGGKVLFLDRSNINTDEIIPAKYLTEITKEALTPHILEDLKLDDFDPGKDITGEIGVVVTRGNFGCGSSREHAAWVFEVNNIRVVIAESYARIFRQNMFNCGNLAIQLPKAEIDRIFAMKSQGVHIDIDLEKMVILAQKGSLQAEKISFEITPFDKALVEAGGWLDYAEKNY